MKELYCVKQRKFTPNLENTKEILKTKNNRLMVMVKCAECGIWKTELISSVHGSGIDLQKAMSPLRELHLRTFSSMKKYQFCGPGTNLEKRLERGEKGINRLDEVCRKHDIDYGNAKNLKDKHIADQKMIDAISEFNDPSLMERAIRNVMRVKKKLGLGIKKQKTQDLVKSP